MNNYQRNFTIALFLGALSACGSFYKSQWLADSHQPLDTGGDQFWQAVKSGKPLLR